MKPIPLTKGKIAWVDDEDYEWLSQWKWHAHKGNKTWYAARAIGHGRGNRTIVVMHREILGYGPDDPEVDHRNNDGLLNIRQNLRAATRAQQIMNAGARKNSKSGHKGISWSKELKKWRVQLGLHRKSIHGGVFDDLDEAIQARNKLAKSLHGDFANTN